jgi:MFS family permease
MNNLKGKPTSVKVRALSLVMSITSLGIGILSFWPYPYLASRFYFPILRQKPFLHSAFDLGCLGGFPLRLVGIILGVLAWRRSHKNIIVVTMAVIGILLSIGGIAGHVWFIITCQFCQ